MDSFSYLSVLNPEQLEAVVHEGSPLLILAGAGSGKTRVITTKIAYLIGKNALDPRSILAVTFTKKAANEMAERARCLEPQAAHTQIRTFHSFGAWFLRSHAEQAGLDSNFTVYDDDDAVTLLARAAPNLSRNQASHLAHKISLAKDYCLSPDSPDLVKIESDPKFPELYHIYQKRLRETGNADFGDLIMLPVLTLQNNETLRERMRRRFKVVMVDEYQDSNAAQFQLLQQLAGTDTYICVVGDDDQSIYKFRGAEVQNILTFPECFPDTKIIRLERNYRSVSPILRIADKVVQNNKERLGKTLKAERGEGMRPKLVFLPTQDDETAYCAGQIRDEYIKGCPYSDWAILYRTNAQSLGFETEFLRQKIPYTVVGSLKFYEREEIKDLLAFLALTANPKDEIAFRRIINKPARGIGAVSQDKIIEYARTQTAENNTGFLDGCRAALGFLSTKAHKGAQNLLDLFAELAADIDAEKPAETLAVFVEKISKKSGLAEYHSAQDEIAGTQRLANMQELANSAALYPNTRAGLFDFLDHIELDRTLEFAGDDPQSQKDAVTLITLHNTKGLEFPRVIITGLERGIFPRTDKDEAEIEEERRLFYVGITRAQDFLYMSSCSMRRVYGKTEYMDPSPFLFELDRSQVDIEGSKPLAFRRAVKTAADGLAFTPEQSLLSDLFQKWAKGVKIFHDDWGYGCIIKTSGTDDNNYVINVQFETGGIKRFMPKFQANKLLIVKD